MTFKEKKILKGSSNNKFTMKLKVLYAELKENLVPTIGNQCPNYWE